MLGFGGPAIIAFGFSIFAISDENSDVKIGNKAYSTQLGYEKFVIRRSLNIIS